jgi:hypothetical protein
MALPLVSKTFTTYLAFEIFIYSPLGFLGKKIPLCQTNEGYNSLTYCDSYNICYVSKSGAIEIWASLPSVLDQQ